MYERTTPPFRSDQVGSLIRPDALTEARRLAGAKQISAADLQRIQHEAIRDVVRLQEEIGFKSITDGEFNRGSWQRDFLLKLENVALVPSKMSVRFHTAEGVKDRAPPSLEVKGKLARRGGIFVDDFKFLKSVTRQTPKVTIPSPTVLHFRGGRKTISEKAYPDMNEFFADLARVYREEIADLAAAGCRYLQIDEVNLAYLCDPHLRNEVAGFGEDPDALPKTYAKLINDAIAGRPKDMVVGLHLCRGNFAGAWVAEGGYEPVAELLFNEINVDAYFLEYDSPRAGGFEPLRFLPQDKLAVLGLITTKSPQLEKKDELKRRIDEASRIAPLEQLALSPQCGFSSGIDGQAMRFDDEVQKLRLTVETAREVWGTA
ncbi:MAG: 5-methyltetrahydropteroyltriglutamate--homocysteine S-methyltransferase [Bradyrhizobiaceae bacterium]|nr:5-methyltetrahydropteroyltriglutamate--homocysteine S-methyltransferase [Bradyrhizobiaceae bacterium]